MKKVEELMSDYREDSEVAQINKYAGKRFVKVSDETLYVIKQALKVASQSEGAFDPTVRPLLEIWGFKEAKFVPPRDEEIKKALEFVGWKKVEVKEESIKLRYEGMRLDLGGIAKGYAVDKAVDVLRRYGIDNAIVEIGGDLYCLGKGLNSKGWRIGIRHPRKKFGIIAKIYLSDDAVATSGSYENYIRWKGKLYPHIIDPREGIPVQNSLLSVTIIAPTCLEADAWATALFVMGWEKAKKVIEEKGELEGVLIREVNGKLDVWVSSGLKGKVELLER
jgi:thiamine biosynthesis lipoprotein